MLEINLSEEERRAVWLELRRQGIGGSDAPVILGLSPWKSPLALWAGKTGLVESNESEAEWQEWGKILEEPIATKYQKTTGRELFDNVKYAVWVSADKPFMLCTPDRLIMPNGEKERGILEIKTAAWMKSGEWEEEPPLAYQVQMQHMLSVTGLTWGSFAVLIGGQKFRWCDVNRNDNFIKHLIEQEEIFWDGVQRGIPPEVDASDSTREVLGRLYPRDTGASIELPIEAISWDEQLQFAKAEIKAAEERKQEAENQLKAAIGAAAIGLLPGGGGYSWKASERAAYAVEAKTIRTLRRIKR